MNGTPAYVNQSAVTIAQNKPGDVEENTKRYIAIFQGVLMFSLRLGTSIILTEDTELNCAKCIMAP